ncbi:hypothetical protein LINPERPRIM_LOCUS561 [Linum perenne]
MQEAPFPRRKTWGLSILSQGSSLPAKSPCRLFLRLYIFVNQQRQSCFFIFIFFLLIFTLLSL